MCVPALSGVVLFGQVCLGWVVVSGVGRLIWVLSVCWVGGVIGVIGSVVVAIAVVKCGAWGVGGAAVVVSGGSVVSVSVG